MGGEYSALTINQDLIFGGNIYFNLDLINQKFYTFLNQNQISGVKKNRNLVYHLSFDFISIRVKQVIKWVNYPYNIPKYQKQKERIRHFEFK